MNLHRLELSEDELTLSPLSCSALKQTRFIETAAAFGAFRRNRYGAEEEDLDFEADLENGESSADDEEDEE